jgi:hypothetical protein
LQLVEAIRDFVESREFISVDSIFQGSAAMQE